MFAKGRNASKAVRVGTAIAMLAVVAVLALLSGSSHTGGDPCASGNAPQVCEAQQRIDVQHSIENAAAEAGR